MDGKTQAVPGHKQPYDENKHAQKIDETDTLEPISAAISVANKGCLKIRFADETEYVDAPAGPTEIPRHTFLFGPIGASTFKSLPAPHCPYTGLHRYEIPQIDSAQLLQTGRTRSDILAYHLREVSAWEISISHILAAIYQKNKDFNTKKIGGENRQACREGQAYR